MRFAQTLSHLLLPRRYALSPESRCSPQECNTCLRYKVKAIEVQTSAFGMNYSGGSDGTMVTGHCGSNGSGLDCDGNSSTTLPYLQIDTITRDCNQCQSVGPCGTVNALSGDPCPGCGWDIDSFSGALSPACGVVACGTCPGNTNAFGQPYRLGNWDTDILSRIQGQLQSIDFDSMPWNSIVNTMMEFDPDPPCNGPFIIGGPDQISIIGDPNIWFTSGGAGAPVSGPLPYFLSLNGNAQYPGGGVFGGDGAGGGQKIQILLESGWACTYSFPASNLVVTPCSCVGCYCNNEGGGTGPQATAAPCTPQDPADWSWTKYGPGSLITLSPGIGQTIVFFLFPTQCAPPCVDIQEFSGRCCNAT